MIVNGSFSTIRISSNFRAKLFNNNFDALLVSCPLGSSPSNILRQELLGKKDLLSKLETAFNNYDSITDFSLMGFELTEKFKLILAPNENSYYYSQNSPVGRNIWIDFLYASTYYSLVLASNMNVKVLAFTHTLQAYDLGMDDRFDRLFIYCIGDAIKKYCDSYRQNTIEEIVFTGCCLKAYHLDDLFTQNHRARLSNHEDLPHQILSYSDKIIISIQV
jgi:hypothetical protein